MKRTESKIMIFLIRFCSKCSEYLFTDFNRFALMSWFPNAYESRLDRLIVSLVKPIVAPLQRLPLSDCRS